MKVDKQNKIITIFRLLLLLVVEDIGLLGLGLSLGMMQWGNI